MPLIEAHLIKGYAAEAKTRLGEALTDAVRLVVPAPPEAITVMIHELAPDAYMRGRTHRTPAPPLPDPVAVVRAYLAALEARDLTAAQACLAERAEMIFPSGQTFSRLSDLTAWAATRYTRIAKTYQGFETCAVDGATIVYCRGTLAGTWPDGTPFTAIRFIDRFELTEGLITRQDVWNDLAEHTHG